MVRCERCGTEYGGAFDSCPACGPRDSFAAAMVPRVAGDKRLHDLMQSMIEEMRGTWTEEHASGEFREHAAGWLNALDFFEEYLRQITADP